MLGRQQRGSYTRGRAHNRAKDHKWQRASYEYPPLDISVREVRGDAVELPLHDTMPLQEHTLSYVEHPATKYGATYRRAYRLALRWAISLRGI